jgi:hypothetical protein
LFVWQSIDRGADHLLRLICDFKLRLDRPPSFGVSFRFPSRSPTVAPNEIERNGTHGCVEQRAVIDVVITSPKLDESFLNNVFGVGTRSNPLPGEEKQARGDFRKTCFPSFMGDDIVHDLFTVFYNQDAAKCAFCLKP